MLMNPNGVIVYQDPCWAIYFNPPSQTLIGHCVVSPPLWNQSTQACSLLESPNALLLYNSHSVPIIKDIDLLVCV